VITDGAQTLELYDVGPNAYSEELTVAYPPKRRILWQADLYFVPSTGSSLNKAMPITIEFAKKLESLGLTNFERIVEGMGVGARLVHPKLSFQRGGSAARIAQFPGWVAIARCSSSLVGQ
jgi:hypothetical protein